MISFEVTDDTNRDVLEVYLDTQGLDDLLAQLAFLVERKTDHVHLMAESWGGYDLSEKPLRDSATPIKHVKINLLQR